MKVFSSKDYHNILSSLRKHVASYQNEHANFLLYEIEVLATEDYEFKAKFFSWMCGDVKTRSVFLRDEICDGLKGKFKSENDWFNGVAFIDAASCRIF